MRKMKFLIIPLILTLSGCSSMLSDYERQEMPEVKSFAEADKYLGGALNENFWEDFQDPLLNALIMKGLEHNYDLLTAKANVEKALINLDISGTDRHPTLSGTLRSSKSKNLDNGNNSKSGTGSFGISYETDLFGKISASVQSSLESYRATAYDYLAMRLTIVNSVADAYWQYAYAKEWVKLGEQDLKDSQKRLDLIRGQYQNGAVASLELDRATIDHLGVQRDLLGRLNTEHQARTALDVLVGETPDKDFEIDSLDKAVLPKFSLDIPATLLSRRPDLMEYEAEIRKALADYDVKKLAFFPDFTLTADLSTGRAGTLFNFLADPVAALGGAITFPFLNFNELSLEREAALKDVDIAKLNFAHAYIQAVQEVYDEVRSITYYTEAVVMARDEVDLSRRNYNMYYERYSQGLEPLSDLLDAADTLRSAESSYLQLKRDLLQSQLALMIALGGDTEKEIEKEDLKALEDDNA